MMAGSIVNSEILVIGDVMLDQYCFGSVSRISPEAPVPVVRLDQTTLRAGGAANVAANIAGLGATPHLVGVIGEDEEANIIPQVVEDAGVSNHHLLRFADRKTTTKTRILAHSQQIARLDQETTEELSESDTDQIIDEIAPLIERSKLIVLSDYAKGMITPRLISKIVSLGKLGGKMVLVDPKGNNFDKYRGASIITPNQREAAIACGYDPDEGIDVEKAGAELLVSLDLDAVLVTQGEQGMTLFERDKPNTRISAIVRRVFDVTGAGDTAIATMAAALGSGMTLVESAEIANIAAGLVVEKVGTTPISAEMLFSEYRQVHN